MPYIMTMETFCNGMQPAYSPQGVNDLVEDYSAFIFETKEDADADVASEVEAERAAVARGDLSDHDENAYTVHECVVSDNGDITLYPGSHDILMTRGEIYRAFGMDLPGTPSPK